MEVVILAGGFGTRIRPLTYTRPKPLLPLLEGTLLSHIIEQLPARVQRILLPVNYLREQIEAYFEEHPDPRVVLVEETTPLGTGGAIKNCQDHLTGPFFVYNGDVVASLDLEALWQQHQATKADATISLWPVEEPWHFGVVQLDSDGRIRHFAEKPPRGTEPSNLINAGHYLLNPRLLEEIPAGRFFSIERELFTPMAAQGRALYGLPFAGYWFDCGQPQSLLQAHAALLRQRGTPRWIARGAHVAASAHLEGYAVGVRCRVEAGARIERSVLLPGAHVGRNAVVRDSILGEGVVVGADARLEQVVVGDFAEIADGTQLRNQRVGMRAADVET